MMQLQHHWSELSQAGIVAWQHTSKTITGPYSYSCTWITQNQGDCWPVAMHTEQPHTVHRLLTWHTVADSWVGQHGLQDTISSRLNDVDPG